MGIVVIVGVVAIAVLLVCSFLLRRVVNTNMVHIVQRRTSTVPYGTGQDAGNVYYAWPSWVPFFGIKVIILQVSNFELPLIGYEAYDKDRVPFVVDVVAFFRIKNTAKAAQRVSNISEMREQLAQIVKGAVRKVLASDVIDKIMVERSQFGDAFTAEVSAQLEEWGVESVKSMELMDIRDGESPEHQSVSAIMAKKVSHISMESRIEVAKNGQAAKTAEIEAQRAIDVAAEEAKQLVGQRAAEKNKAVGIADREAEKAIHDAERETREAQMAVTRVQQVRQAEITRDEQIVAAEQAKQTAIIVADGQLQSAKLAAEGVQVTGAAEAAAEQAKLMAPVNSQIALAQEIGENEGYQRYLVLLEAIKAHLAVGTEQAKALQGADVKVIANTGKPTEGAGNVMDLFTSGGGTQLSAMVEAFAQSPLGNEILKKLGVDADGVASKADGVTVES